MARADSMASAACSGLRPLPKLNVLGVAVSVCNYDDVVDFVGRAARERRSVGLTALAVHGVMTAYLDPTFRKAVNSLDVATPDGQPVRWMLNALGAALRGRVYGPDLTLKVCEYAADAGLPVFFLGSTPDVVNALSRNLSTRFPALKVAGVQPDRFRAATPDEDAQDVQRINDSGAAIVFVGTGCPRQERWVSAHLGRIHAPMIAVGAAFPFHAGLLPQAPVFMQDRGLEWLFRLCQEPRRLWRRYLLLNPAFATLAALQLLGWLRPSDTLEPNG